MKLRSSPTDLQGYDDQTSANLRFRREISLTAEAELIECLGVELCFRDPGVAVFASTTGCSPSATSSSRSSRPRRTARPRVGCSTRSAAIVATWRSSRPTTSPAQNGGSPMPGCGWCSSPTARASANATSTRRTCRARSCRSIRRTSPPSGRGPERRGAITWTLVSCMRSPGSRSRSTTSRLPPARWSAALGVARHGDTIEIDRGAIRFRRTGDREPQNTLGDRDRVIAAYRSCERALAEIGAGPCEPRWRCCGTSPALRRWPAFRHLSHPSAHHGGSSGARTPGFLPGAVSWAEGIR